MGGERQTTQNLSVVRVDTALNLIFIKGAVPGVDDAHVLVSDALKKVVNISRANAAKGKQHILPEGVLTLPFPAGTAELALTLPREIAAATRGRDPFSARE